MNRTVRTADPTSYSVAFARSRIRKTPPVLREVRRRKRNPWNKSAEGKSDLLKKLAKVDLSQT